MGSNDRFRVPRWDAFSDCDARFGSSGGDRVDHSFNDGLGDTDFGIGGRMRFQASRYCSNEDVLIPA